MAEEYYIRRNFEYPWRHGQQVAASLLRLTQQQIGIAHFPVHGDPLLSQLDDHELLCYFVYTLSSWWEIPLIDRINANRRDNGFAILMDINPAPETFYRVHNEAPGTPEARYKSGLREIFPDLERRVADAMYRLLRNGFGHNLFGREPGKIRFDEAFESPPLLDENNVLLVPPAKLALSMVNAFLTKIATLYLEPTADNLRIFKQYMTEPA